MKKIVVIIVLIIIIVVATYFLFFAQKPENLTAEEKSCIDSGGTISTSNCCKLTSDFPNSCLIGACGCSLENSKEVKICDCGSGCWDGTKCVKKELNINENSARQVGSNLVLLDVPFTSQAPFGDWKNPIFQNACEEASLLMAILWVRGEKTISKEQATVELTNFADFETKKYNNFYDHSAKDTAQIMRDYFEYNNIEVKENIDAGDIINELSKGNLVIVPVNGQKLENPFYTSPGPIEHMLVIIGYDFSAQEFITNDSGTRHGEKYRYPEDILENALQNYPTGNKEAILEISKAMIVVKK